MKGVKDGRTPQERFHGFFYTKRDGALWGLDLGGQHRRHMAHLGTYKVTLILSGTYKVTLILSVLIISEARRFSAGGRVQRTIRGVAWLRD